MAKSSKKNNDAISGAGSASEPQEVAPEITPAATERSMTAKVTPKAAKKRTGTATRKTSATAKPRKTPSRKKLVQGATAVSDEDIRLRAYFIAENRAEQGLPNDSSSDWLEARRQLLAEAAGQA